MLFRQWRNPYRIISSLMCAALVAAISYLWVFVPAPMELQSWTSIPDYGPGSTIGGVAWQPYESELDFTMTSLSESDYDNVVIEIAAENFIIEDIKQTAGLLNCSASTLASYNAGRVQHFENGRPIGPAGIGGVNVNGEQYTYKVLPMRPD